MRRRLNTNFSEAETATVLREACETFGLGVEFGVRDLGERCPKAAAVFNRATGRGLSCSPDPRAAAQVARALIDRPAEGLVLRRRRCSKGKRAAFRYWVESTVSAPPGNPADTLRRGAAVAVPG